MCLFMLVMVIGSVASANYPTHLNGNANYILVDGHMGTAWYVDKSSLVVQKYEPPQYIIAVNVESWIPRHIVSSTTGIEQKCMWTVPAMMAG